MPVPVRINALLFRKRQILEISSNAPWVEVRVPEAIEVILTGTVTAVTKYQPGFGKRTVVLIVTTLVFARE